MSLIERNPERLTEITKEGEALAGQQEAVLSSLQEVQDSLDALRGKIGLNLLSVFASYGLFDGNKLLAEVTEEKTIRFVICMHQIGVLSLAMLDRAITKAFTPDEKGCLFTVNGVGFQWNNGHLILMPVLKSPEEPLDGVVFGQRVHELFGDILPLDQQSVRGAVEMLQRATAHLYDFIEGVIQTYQQEMAPAE